MIVCVIFLDIQNISAAAATDSMISGAVHSPDKYELIALRDIDDATDVGDALNVLWAHTQNITDENWIEQWQPESRIKSGPQRSSMVGDIFMIDREFYKVGMTGFEELDDTKYPLFLDWMIARIQKLLEANPDRFQK